MNSGKLADKTIGGQIAAIRKGETIYYIRDTLSQEALSSSTGIQRSRLGRIERGETSATPYELALICHQLGITPNDLFRPSFCERFKTETFIGNLINLMFKRVW